ncbi:MAG: site-specific DNA-methyltransferase [Phycisphaerales bacterium]|nr:site-specific DNA-methyltransferase [Phycisphaerales bacterium]
MKPAHRFFCHSSECMEDLGDAEVALTITSPPYWNAIDYDRHTADRGQNYRTRSYANGFSGYDEYLDLMDRVFREVLRVTKPGGFCAVVIGTVLFKAKPVPVPFDFTYQMVSAGWEFHQDIIWHKCTAGVKRAGVTIQKPFPGYYYPNIMTEYILVFRRPGPRISDDRTKREVQSGAFPINALFTKDLANNIWHIAPVPPGHLDHPCPFPEEIPYRLATLYSYPDDLVLDPFLGSGQTTKVAAQIGRRVVGYDVEKQYVDYAKRRLREPLAIRPQQLIAAFEKIAIDAPLSGPGRRNGASHGRRRHRSSTKQETLFAE